MTSQSQGIQQLLQAEKRAKDKLEEAKKSKSQAGLDVFFFLSLLTECSLEKQSFLHLFISPQASPAAASFFLFLLAVLGPACSCAIYPQSIIKCFA